MWHFNFIWRLEKKQTFMLVRWTGGELWELYIGCGYGWEWWFGFLCSSGGLAWNWEVVGSTPISGTWTIKVTNNIRLDGPAPKPCGLHRNSRAPCKSTRCNKLMNLQQWRETVAELWSSGISFWRISHTHTWIKCSPRSTLRLAECMYIYYHRQTQTQTYIFTRHISCVTSQSCSVS